MGVILYANSRTNHTDRRPVPRRPFVPRPRPERQAQAGRGGGGDGGDGGSTRPYVTLDLLGELRAGGGYQSRAHAVSDPDESGNVHVAGITYPFDRDPVSGRYGYHPARWSVDSGGNFDPTTCIFDLPVGAWEAGATGVNSAGIVILNTEQTDLGVYPGWIDIPGQDRQQIPGVLDDYSPARSINNHHEIVGLVADDAQFFVGALWTLDEVDGLLVPSEPVPLGEFSPQAINDSGLVAGSHLGQAAILALGTGEILPIGPPSSETFSSEATALSANGQWVIGTQTALEGTRWVTRGFVWSSALGYEVLGSLERNGWSRPHGVNDKGQVVGASSIKSTRYAQAAFLWENGAMRNLNDLTDSPSGVHLTDAFAVNEAGHVVGALHVEQTSEQHAFLVIPRTLLPSAP